MSELTEPTTQYWQTLHDDWPGGSAPAPPFRLSYPIRLPDGRVLVLPLRELPDGQHAVASLIANQASFAVLDALAAAMAELARKAAAELVVGLPTLGLALAPLVARHLGHTRYIPLGYSRKYWYDAALSEPISSITSPSAGKQLFLDPNVAPLLSSARVCVVDDAVSSGASILAVHRLFRRLGIAIPSIVVAMKQTTRWQQPLGAVDPALPSSLHAVFGCPLFARHSDGWIPVEGTMPEVP